MNASRGSPVSAGTKATEARGELARVAHDRPFTFADLFAGVGVFHLALRRLGGRCTFACEIDPAARFTYWANHGAHAPSLLGRGGFARDITRVDPSRIPDFDIVAAGFPCQAFSMAGRRQGFRDPRGCMVFEVARIIEAKRPAAYVLENVQGLLSHDKRRTFAAIRGLFEDDLGYSFHHKVLRAFDFGLPQHRPRVFMVGFRKKDTPFSFPEPIPLTVTLSDIVGGQCETEIAYTIRTTGGGCARTGVRGRDWLEYLVDGERRPLTLTEIRRLMGFTEDFWFPRAKAKAVKQIGNSIAVPVAEAVALEVVKALNSRAVDHGRLCPPPPSECAHDVGALTISSIASSQLASASEFPAL